MTTAIAAITVIVLGLTGLGGFAVWLGRNQPTEEEITETIGAMTARLAVENAATFGPAMSSRARLSRRGRELA